MSVPGLVHPEIAMGDDLCIVPGRARGAGVGIEARLRAMARWTDRAGFALLVLTIIALLLRPADLVARLAGAPVYQACIALCMLASLPGLLSRPRLLRGGAIAASTVMLVPAVALSHLVQLHTWEARAGAVEAAKACTLFLLMVVIVERPEQLRVLLLAVAASVLGMTVLAVLNFHGVLDIAALSSVVQRDLSAEDGANIRRLCGTGIFNDPNDYALMLVLCMCVCVYGAGRARWWGWRAPAWGAFAFLGYALVLTHSRGGVLSVMAAAGAFVVARLGWRNAVPLAAPLGALIMGALWGRQTELNLSDPNDTFQGRMDLWSASMDVFRAHPILGIGQGKLVDEIGQVTHNSFLHAFAEMGLVGGTVFIGAFYLAFRGLSEARPADEELSRLRPCVLAILVGYSVGMLALSRCYTAPVQLVLGLATAFLVMASERGRSLIPRLDWRCLVRVWSVGVVFLGATYVFIRVMKNHAG